MIKLKRKQIVADWREVMNLIHWKAAVTIIFLSPDLADSFKPVPDDLRGLDAS